MNILPSTWAFRCKRYPDASVQKLKARFFLLMVTSKLKVSKHQLDYSKTHADPDPYPEPIYMSGRLHGCFCPLSHRPQPKLGQHVPTRVRPKWHLFRDATRVCQSRQSFKTSTILIWPQAITMQLLPASEEQIGSCWASFPRTNRSMSIHVRQGDHIGIC